MKFQSCQLYTGRFVQNQNLFRLLSIVFILYRSHQSTVLPSTALCYYFHFNWTIYYDFICNVPHFLDICMFLIPIIIKVYLWKNIIWMTEWHDMTHLVIGSAALCGGNGARVWYFGCYSVIHYCVAWNSALRLGENNTTWSAVSQSHIFISVGKLSFSCLVVPYARKFILQFIFANNYWYK